MTGKMFSVREVANRKNVTPSAIHLAARRGLLHKIVQDQRVVFAAEDVEQYMRRRRGRRAKEHTSDETQAG